MSRLAAPPPSLLALLALLLSAVGGRAPLTGALAAEMPQRGGCAYAEAEPGGTVQSRKVTAQRPSMPVELAQAPARISRPSGDDAGAISASVLRLGSAGGPRAP